MSYSGGDDMEIEGAITTALKAVLDAKVYPGGKAPENVTAPYPVFWMISDSPEARRLKNPYPRYQFDHYGNTYSEVKARAKLCYNALADRQGILGGTGGIPVNYISYEGGDELPDPATGLFRVTQDFKIRFKEE